MPEGKPKREQPWAVRGISMEARSAAAIAARKSGQSLGAWLDRVVRDAATDAIKSAPRQEVIDPTNEEAVRQLARDMVQRVSDGFSKMEERLEQMNQAQREQVERALAQRPAQAGFTISLPRFFGGKK